MLLWLLDFAAWHMGFYPPVTVWGMAIFPFLLLTLVGWQLFGPPVQG